MGKLLLVIDMQNDFIDGVLGTPEAVAILPAVEERVKKRQNEGWDVWFTMDTHNEEKYIGSKEGEWLPVPHCIKGTDGWQLRECLWPYADTVIEKPNFGSINVAFKAAAKNYEEVELIGLCTDICVISNAMILKAALPESDISVVKDCCAGVTPESHENALSAMEKCHIKIV
ncbi:MAG: cysteine hydrolase [Firmicutes bacterium]|nr:cysteine hydrolase [Bacillota bacterium]